MDEHERDLSPTKPKNPFRKEIWLHATLDKDRQVSAEVLQRCQESLRRALGRVEQSYPNASEESKSLLHRTSEEIMQALGKASRLRVLDPVLLEKHSENYTALLEETKRKREMMEQCNERGRAWYAELQRKHGPKDEFADSSGESTSY